MKRWTAINLVLATLAGAMLLADRLPAPHDGGAPPLTRLLPAEIHAVRIERGNRLEIALARDSGGWRLTHPADGTADTPRVERLLAVAAAPAAFCMALQHRDADFGLLHPRAVLQFDTVRLAFGDRDATGRARYVQVGDQVCVVDDAWYNLLALPASHYEAR